MAIKFFAPQGKDAIEAGSIIDDDGQRFMLVTFTDEAGDQVAVSMLIPLFQEFAAYMGELAALSATRDFWRDHPRG
jgi:hypothetical protein